MNCQNVNCKHYRKPSKATWVERMLNRKYGFATNGSLGGCDKPYCKLSSKR